MDDVVPWIECLTHNWAVVSMARNVTLIAYSTGWFQVRIQEQLQV